ncbi:MAG: hypothetical protein V5A34_05610 [Halapricum sp.]
MVHHEDYTHELEQEGRVETALIGLRYTGSKSSVAPNTPRQNGGWPGTQTFQGGPPTKRNESGKVVARDPGPIQIGLNPDWLDDSVQGGSLVGLEALPDFEVIYDEAAIAKAMLEMNYLPPAVFGSPPDQTGGERVTPNYEVRQAVFDHLELDDIGSGPGSHETYREQLAKIPDVDLGDDEATVESSRIQDLQADHTRAELKHAVDALREGPDEITLQGGKAEFAEYLAQQDPQDVRAALAGEYDGEDDGDTAE